MPSFSNLLSEAVRHDWKDSYINYSELKDLLERFAQRRASINPATIGRSSKCISLSENDYSVERFYNLDTTQPHEFLSLDILKPNKKERYLAFIEQEELSHVLDNAIEKVEVLYLNQIGVLQKRINELVQQIQIDGWDKSGDSSKQCNDLGSEIIELYSFVGANAIALRQILIRYDCLIRTLDGPPIGQGYIKQRRTSTRTEGIFTRRQLILLANDFVVHFMKAEEECAVALHTEVGQMEVITQKAEQALDIAMSGRWAVEDSLMHTLQYYFLAGSLLIDLKLVPSFIRTRGASLKKEIEYFAAWRKNQTELGSNMNGIDIGEKGTPTRLKDALTASLMLNFLAQLFYMMNHYIIEPSSTQYISELGGNAALSGMLIGVTPWAALMSTFGYSLWSNQSFRSPMLCSALFLTSGSFVYANALKFHSVTLAMVGRFMTGLGAPCGMNIRIIADTVSARHRTIVSAIFMSSSALGMSLGPALAIGLDFLNEEFDIPLYGKLYLNGMTGPGYLMSTLWFIYTITLFFLFEDEERIGLKEIEKKSKEVEEYCPPSANHGDDLSVSTDRQCSANSIISVKSDVVSEASQMEEKRSKVMNEATLVCMAIKFIGKFVVEIFGCSVSLITMHRYQWTVKNIGSLSFINGCLIIPISTAVGYLSQHYSDRTLLVGLLSLALFGILLLVDYSDLGELGEDYESYYDDQYENIKEWNWAVVGPKRYVAGVILQFCALQASQSITLSMMSKVIPLALAKGTWNSGFIATSITTLSRAFGDLFITAMGLISLRELLNFLAVPAFLLVSFSIMLAIFHGHKLPS